MYRREFLGITGVAAALQGAPRSWSFQPGQPSRGTKTARPRILAAHLGKPIRYPESHGDLWTATWADDDSLYVASDDTQGLDKACSSNLAVSRISGRMPPDLKGVTVNPMKDYGGWGEVKKEDSAMWKACGLTSIDGVLYLTVSRHFSPPNTFCIQETWDASVVKSTDHGRTWSAAPKFSQAMFPGRPFSTPFFVDYGKDGQGGKHGQTSTFTRYPTTAHGTMATS